MLRPLTVIFSFVLITPAFAVSPVDTSSQLIISVRDQKLMLVQNGGKVATYPVSTSMFGLGDAWGQLPWVTSPWKRRLATMPRPAPSSTIGD
jgi:hypothetical protein